MQCDTQIAKFQLLLMRNCGCS